MIKLVFADKDMFYISRVVMRFAEELNFRADISVITEEKYAAETFGSPVSADLLMISEELLPYFSADRFRGKTVILTEEENEGNMENADCVYKYNSITQIIEQVRALVPEVFRCLPEEEAGCLLTAVYPVCGSCGQAAQMTAEKLLDQGHTAVYLNAAWLQSFQLALSDRTPIPEKFLDSFRTWNAGKIEKVLKQLIRREAYEYFPPFPGNITALGLDFEVYLRIAETLRSSGLYEFVVMDTENGLDAERFRIFSAADQVLLVSGNADYDDMAYELLKSQLADPDSPKYLRIVLNGSRVEDEREIGKTVKILTERLHE